MSYLIPKDHIVTAFSMIIDSLNAAKPIPYKDIMPLDLNLQKARSLFPSFLQIRPPSQSYSEPVDLIMKRYFLEVLFLKARCVLHRRYLTHEPTNSRYCASRTACLDSARQILRHQADIYRECQPNGMLHENSWFLLSLTTSDFLLSAMIICLSISQRRQSLNANHDVAALGFPAADEDVLVSLVQELQTSQRIWMSLSYKFDEASRAAEAVGLMRAQVVQGDSASHVGAAAGCGRRTTDALRPDPGFHAQPGNNVLTTGGVDIAGLHSVMTTDAEFDWVSYIALSLSFCCTSEATLTCVGRRWGTGTSRHRPLVLKRPAKQQQQQNRQRRVYRLYRLCRMRFLLSSGLQVRILRG